ncbi:GNAT family N-acetyltransferase [Brachybacterium tyrofermentans]|uniref:GNAT family N-acetyltransferase n=1 Tax=Brachybacterium tyrofermentans TaxID=47848 RepID=A0ABW0FGP4_9MICO
MHFSIRPLDPTSDLELTQYGALDVALDEAAHGGSEVFTLAQRRVLLTDTPYYRTQRWVAVAEPVEGGEVLAGIASVYLPQQENLDTISVGASVHPAFRGQGIATALVEEALIPAIRESGRALVECYGAIPADGDPDDPSVPTNRLAARLGISRRNVAVCRILPLPLETSLLDQLQAQVDEKIGDYRLELWDGGIPEEHLTAYGLLMRQLELDEPDEEVEHEAPEYTPERIRTMVQRLQDAGTRAIIAVAVAPDGSFVGNCEVHLQQEEGTTIAWQENTLVMPDHRGHRLGLALKVATHRLLTEQAPHVRSIATWNSHVNPWMIAINEALGYRIAYREIALQGRPQH